MARFVLAIGVVIGMGRFVRRLRHVANVTFMIVRVSRPMCPVCGNDWKQIARSDLRCSVAPVKLFLRNLRFRRGSRPQEASGDSSFTLRR